MAFRTSNGVESVLIGKRKWTRWPGAAGWQESPVEQGLPFSTRRWFRWTPYARHVRLLDERTVDGRHVAELALFDPGTPVWIRLTVDTASQRVLRERSITKAHFSQQRYHAFNAPVSIPNPGAADGR